jgi:hypothetical protein
MQGLEPAVNRNMNTGRACVGVEAMSMRTVAIPLPDRSLSDGWEALLECVMARDPEPEVTAESPGNDARGLIADADPGDYLPILRRQRLSREVYQPAPPTTHPSRSFGRLHNRQSSTWLPTLRLA